MLAYALATQAPGAFEARDVALGAAPLLALEGAPQMGGSPAAMLAKYVVRCRHHGGMVAWKDSTPLLAWIARRRAQRHGD